MFRVVIAVVKCNGVSKYGWCTWSNLALVGQNHFRSIDYVHTHRYTHTHIHTYTHTHIHTYTHTHIHTYIHRAVAATTASTYQFL